MKNRFLFLIYILLFGGCAELEQSDPLSPTGEQFFKTNGDLQAAVTATYSAWTNGNSSLYYRNITGFVAMSDNNYHGSSLPDGSQGRWSTFVYDPTDPGINQVYTGLYRVINHANQVITDGPRTQEDPSVTDAVLNQAIAEATFHKAYAHFLLTLIWGDVAIVDEQPQDPANFQPVTSPASEVYEKVIEYLQFAEANLSTNPAQGGRVTSWTAKAFFG